MKVRNGMKLLYGYDPVDDEWLVVLTVQMDTSGIFYPFLLFLIRERQVFAQIIEFSSAHQALVCVIS